MGAHPCLVASVTAGYDVTSLDWRNREGIEAYLIPKYW
jgi:hypothetical protein